VLLALGNALMENGRETMLITMCVAIGAGVGLFAVARRLGLPAIVLLLLGGILLGPYGLGWTHPDSLGDGLPVIVSLAVALILFEGGMNLSVKGYRSAPTVIRRLLTIGVLTTWVATGLAVWALFGHDVVFSLLAASLVTVTGPTVITPLLRRIRVKDSLHHILYWEGVLVDPIGVFIALLAFELFAYETSSTALANLAIRAVSGIAVGAGGGVLLWQSMRRKLLPADMTNVSILAVAVATFGLAEAMAPESGLLAVTVAGFTLGISAPPELSQVRRFKAEIADLFIGMLFVLLAGRLDPAHFREFGGRGALLVAIVILVIRPLDVLLSSWGTRLSWQERTFLSWVAPRGIVAASLASAFAVRLQATDHAPAAEFLESFTYSVIMATVLLQGLTAGGLASLLRLKRPEATGWLIVGAHVLGRRLANFLVSCGCQPVVLIDTNARAVTAAQDEGLHAIHSDARDTALQEEYEAISRAGRMVALTDNEDLNERLCHRWREVIGRGGLYRWQALGTALPGGEAPAGRAIFTSLPKPSLLSSELSLNEARISTLTIGRGPIPEHLIPLASAVKGEARLGPLSRTEPLPPGSQVLVLERHTGYLVRSLSPELVLLHDGCGFAQALTALVDLVCRVAPTLNRDDTVRELLEREAVLPSAIGLGVAVPHAYRGELSSRFCALARIAHGVDARMPDGQPVTLVFLVLSPPGNPESHLATLAEIARLAKDATARRRLLDAQSPADVYAAVVAHCTQQ
jgi:NhaP-type Na+/H+ or K+/H+ antiporter/mannitol/fructose-specific phosphotransferase system IIA component (Ntr-type)